ncbi:MAG: pyridoxal-phosphate dependent enzyme [Gammaproteobacteria bacterium]
MKYDSILDAIGHTPAVRINKVAADLDCQVYAKCEFMNPGGSSKDRIGYRMVQSALKSGRIKPGDVLIEPSSGNTGIGIALAGAILGLQVIITMTNKISQEKETILKRLGAKIYRTPTEVSSSHPDSNISLAKRLQKEIPNSHILDQYSNPENPNAHYYGTAEELIEDFGQNLKMVVAGVGTGGTITGIAKRLKEYNSNIQIVGVDPFGSILAGPEEVKPYLVEGIGYDFIPAVLENACVDRYIKTIDKDSFLMARRLIREEGLLVGGSSGAAMCAVLQAARSLNRDQVCVVIFPDSIRNYLTKFVDDDWMKTEGLLT